MSIWQRLYEFFLMGGYAWYVWPAFVVVFLVLALNTFWGFYQQRKAIAVIRAHE